MVKKTMRNAFFFHIQALIIVKNNLQGIARVCSKKKILLFLEPLKVTFSRISPYKHLESSGRFEKKNANLEKSTHGII